MKNLNNIAVTEITDIITIPSEKGRYEKINNRRCYGLSFCIEGQITYIHNKNKYVSDQNNAIILPQGQTYTLYGDKKGVFPVINFKCTDFLCDTMMVIPVSDPSSYIRDYEMMKSLSVFEKNRTKILSIFYDIIFRLSSDSSTEPSILIPILKDIEENYTSPSFTNTLIAQKFGISEIYLRKLFIKHHGTTPKQFIIDIRINKAKQLLADGIFKINAIAEKCGFSNQYHFSRVFKKKTGLSPTEYMKKYRIYKI